MRLRPLRRRDQDTWMELRAQNAAWLEPWDATSPVPVSGPDRLRHVRAGPCRAGPGRRDAAVRHRPRRAAVGQPTCSSITYGSLRSASIGYWVSEHVAGRGITPTAVALATDHCFDGLGCTASRSIAPRTVRRCGSSRSSGSATRECASRFLHIQDRWCDHAHVRADRRGRPRRAPGTLAGSHCRGKGSAADTPRRSRRVPSRRLPS